MALELLFVGNEDFKTAPRWVLWKGYRSFRLIQSKTKRESYDSLFVLVRTTGLELCTVDARYTRLRLEVFASYNTNR